jgi:hypothetical protein
MSTYANIKMGVIFAIYGNPFSRKNWIKNIKQSLYVKYYKRINFRDIILIEKKNNIINNNFFPNQNSSYIMNTSSCQFVPLRMDVNENLRNKNLGNNLKIIKFSSLNKNDLMNKNKIFIQNKQNNYYPNIYCESGNSLTNIQEEKIDFTEIRNFENIIKKKLILKKKALSYRTTIKNGT